MRRGSFIGNLSWMPAASDFGPPPPAPLGHFLVASPPLGPVWFEILSNAAGIDIPVLGLLSDDEGDLFRRFFFSFRVMG